MKKIISILLISLSLVFLISCSNKDNENWKTIQIFKNHPEVINDPVPFHAEIKLPHNFYKTVWRISWKLQDSWVGCRRKGFILFRDGYGKYKCKYTAARGMIFELSDLSYLYTRYRINDRVSFKGFKTDEDRWESLKEEYSGEYDYLGSKSTNSIYFGNGSRKYCTSEKEFNIAIYSHHLYEFKVEVKLPDKEKELESKVKWKIIDKAVTKF